MLTPEYIARRSRQLITKSPMALQVSFRGATARGVRSVLKRQDAATLSGMDAGYSFTVLLTVEECRKWTAAPSSLRDRVEIDGQSYLVLATEYDVAGNLRLHLGGEYG